jgi:hypothetical protein
MKTRKILYLLLCLIVTVSGGLYNVRLGSQASAAAGEPYAPDSYIVNPFTPDWIGESDLPGVAYGASVASAGDVNDDGYTDVIVGAPHYSNGQDIEGRAYLYYGSATGVKPLPAWTFESDLANCELGWSVASAGDVNNDGYDDVLVASEFCVVPRHGRVYLFLGSANGLSPSYAWMKEGGGSEESFGWSVASAGDVNGDGYADVIIGAPWATYDEDHEGRVYVFYGSESGLPDTANWTKESDVHWSGLGVSVASAGDVNNDGYGDVIIGHDFLDNPEVDEGRVYVFLGSASGLANSPVWQYENNHAGSGLGESVASAGDVNNDGYDDVIVGGFRYTNPGVKEGVAYVFLSSASGLSLTPDWTVESNQDYAEYCQSVTSAGDVNDDGYADVLVGAPWYSHGENFEGLVFLYYGSPTGLLPYPVNYAECNQVQANMGYSVASAGDVNGDGIADMIVGAQNYDGGQENEGRAIVYHGMANFDYRLWITFLRR